MADQRQTEFEELTPDQCIDFAAGLLDDEARAEILRRASASPDSEELLRSVMAQAEAARSAASRGREKGTMSAMVESFTHFLDSIFGNRRLVPAMAGASLLVLGLIVGAGTVHLLQTDGAQTGAPARLISLFPSAARTAGPAAAMTPDSGLYIELNGIGYSCETPLAFSLTGPGGTSLLQGCLHCQSETGEWAGLFLPAALLVEEGGYRLKVQPAAGSADVEAIPLEFSFDIRQP